MTRTIVPTIQELKEEVQELNAYADRVLAEGNLAEKLEPYFVKCPMEVSKTTKPKTLAEAVSNSLIQVMPRISPELFELTREVEVNLSNEQRKKVIESLYKRSFDFIYEENGTWDEGRKRFFSDAEVNVHGKIPLFFYGQSSDERVTFGSLNPEISFKRRIETNNLKVTGFRLDTINKRNDIERILYFNPEKEQVIENDRGEFSINLQGTWKAPYKLDVCATVPQVPEGFIELGDEAIATYYDFARQAPSDLRKKTSLQPPSIGILWAPTDESLYATGKIPGPSIIPRSRRDPALVLDIPDREKSYRHIVATWDIGEELPFRNWLTEYMETNGRPNLRSLDGGKK